MADNISIVRTGGSAVDHSADLRGITTDTKPTAASIETDIKTAQKWLINNNFKNIVTDLKSKKNYREANYDGRISIIAGNEHTGISSSWREQPNSESIIIPMLGSVESLNVGFASTLVSYEAGLQKFKNLKY